MGLLPTSRRRVLLATLSAIVACPRAGLTQRKRFRIGWLDAGAPEAIELQALLAGLSDLGYVAGVSFVFDGRWAEGHLDRLPAYVAELISLKPDVIVAR